MLCSGHDWHVSVVRHAFRVALATTIAYWLALSFDWPNPKWAALAVAVVSLPSTGESPRKGRQRLMGTLVGAVVTLVIVSLFPQDRWTFFFCVSAWLSLCTYRMGDPRESYFWYVSGFVVAIVATNVGSDLRDAFDIAVIRSLAAASATLRLMEHRGLVVHFSHPPLVFFALVAIYTVIIRSAVIPP